MRTKQENALIKYDLDTLKLNLLIYVDIAVQQIRYHYFTVEWHTYEVILY